MQTAKKSDIYDSEDIKHVETDSDNLLSLKLLQKVMDIARFSGLFPVNVTQEGVDIEFHKKTFVYGVVILCMYTVLVGFSIMMEEDALPTATRTTVVLYTMTVNLVVYVDILLSWARSKFYVRYFRRLKALSRRFNNASFTYIKSSKHWRNIIAMIVVTVFLMIIYVLENLVWGIYLVDNISNANRRLVHTLAYLIHTLNNMALMVNLYVLYIGFKSLNMHYAKYNTHDSRVLQDGIPVSTSKHAAVKDFYELYFYLKELSVDLNKIFSAQLLSHFFLCFLANLLEIHYKLATDLPPRPVTTKLSLLPILDGPTGIIVMALNLIENEDSSLQKLYKEISRRLILTENDSQDQVVLQCYHIASCKLVKFRAMDMINVDFKMLFSMATSILAYLIILMQF